MRIAFASLLALVLSVGLSAAAHSAVSCWELENRIKNFDIEQLADFMAERPAFAVDFIECRNLRWNEENVGFYRLSEHCGATLRVARRDIAATDALMLDTSASLKKACPIVGQDSKNAVSCWATKRQLEVADEEYEKAEQQWKKRKRYSFDQERERDGALALTMILTLEHVRCKTRRFHANRYGISGVPPACERVLRRGSRDIEEVGVIRFERFGELSEACPRDEPK